MDIQIISSFSLFTVCCSDHPCAYIIAHLWKTTSKKEMVRLKLFDFESLLLPVVYFQLGTLAVGNIYMDVYSSIVRNNSNKLEASKCPPKVEYTTVVY